MFNREEWITSIMDRPLNGWTLPPGMVGRAMELYESDTTILPPPHLVLRALNSVPSGCVSVVLLGQDVYPQPGKATGLSFDVNAAYRSNRPDSLSNLCLEAGCLPDDLQTWPSQGVLMLNAALTVEEGRPGSHLGFWRPYAESLLKQLSGRKVVFLLLGREAQQLVWGIYNKPFRKLIRGCFELPDGNWAVCAGHPSPITAHRDFLGSGVFQEVNNILVHELGKKEIVWNNLECGWPK